MANAVPKLKCQRGLTRSPEGTMFPYHQAITPAVHHLTYMRSNMATSNTLHIYNYLNFDLSITVGNGDNWNCCDYPAPGQVVGHVVPNGHLDLAYCRTDGHGCNGCQGLFPLVLNAQWWISLNFDSNGVMSDPHVNGVQLIQNADGTFSLNIYRWLPSQAQ